jgi:hypothetical protein
LLVNLHFTPVCRCDQWNTSFRKPVTPDRFRIYPFPQPKNCMSTALSQWKPAKKLHSFVKENCGQEM